MYEWNEQLGCLVDYMGLPVPLSEARLVQAKIKLHLKKSPEQLAVIAYAVMQEKYPAMVEQIISAAKDFE